MNDKPLAPSSVELLEQRLEQTQCYHQDFPREEVLLVRMIKLLHKLISDHSNSLLREFGLSHTEYHILIGLNSSAEGFSPGEIAEQICEKAANTTRLLDQLHHKGLITREPSAGDRRRLIVRATPAATELIEHLLPGVSTQMQTLFGGLEAAEREQFKALLGHVIGNLEDHR